MSAAVYAVTHTVTTPPLTGEQITAGKLYRVLYETENSFDIIDDSGKQVPCFWQGCAFGDTWTRCELAADEPAQAANPCAFPHPSGAQGTDGLTMRDWFAGHALVGLLATPDDGTPRTIQGHADHFSETAFLYADAMLAARQTGGAA